MYFCRFTQAGSEVSALLGRIPSAVGYQPTLATDMGTMQERITTTKKGSITSVQVGARCTFALFAQSILTQQYKEMLNGMWKSLFAETDRLVDNQQMCNRDASSQAF